MGAGSSRPGSGVKGEPATLKTSYYELLSISHHATEDEIKKAYRRKALELHPDRNYGNEETATRTFAEVQAAYEVLSDPQERAWYDSHESAILRGDDGSGGEGAEGEVPIYQNVRMTSSDDLARLVRKFDSNVKFDDSPSGFFGFLRETFEQLAREEEVAATWEGLVTTVPEWPTFGHKEDEYDDVVKKFYTAWLNFSTVKSFAWKDKYRLSEAPDRWYRRRMEQENKTFRKEGIREFNDAVRALVAFVRKRDPRYIPSTQSEAERQKILRDAAASQAARARAENLAKLNAEVVPEWTKTREPDEEVESEEEEVEEEILECVACNKTFKSERQFEAHERSKKHQKAVYALQKKMRKENAHLDLNGDVGSSGPATPNVDEEEEEEGEEPQEEEEPLDPGAVSGEDPALHQKESEDARTKTNGLNGNIRDPAETMSSPSNVNESEAHNTRRDTPSPDQTKPEAISEAPLEAPSEGEEDSNSNSDSDSDYAPTSTLATRLSQTTLDTPPSESVDKATEIPPQPKQGKAAQKRAKKAAAAATTNENSTNTHECAACKATFPSKTRLFQHIKDFGHAALRPAGAANGGGGGKKKVKGKR